MAYRTMLDDILARENTTGFQDGKDLEIAREIVEKMPTEEVKDLWVKGASAITSDEFYLWCMLLENIGARILISNRTVPVDKIKVDSIKFTTFQSGHISEPGIIFEVSEVPQW